MRLALATAIGLIALAGAAPARADPAAPGLVAAYSFDEGTGALVGDASGNGHIGTISGATWSAGRYRGGLSFNGTDAQVVLGSLGTFYQSGFTLEAWVQKASASKNDVAVLGSWTSGGGPMIWVDHIATRYHVTLGGGFSGYLDSGANPSAGRWQHLAATFDGSTARFYIDGAQVASRTASVIGSSDTWRIGAYGSSPGGFFDGLIDDVRIYDRALSEAEIQADMDTSVGPVDAAAPSKPGNFAVGAATQTSVTTEWNASTGEMGVLGYTVYLDGTAVATTSATNFVFSGLSCGTPYQLGVEAFDGAGSVSPRALLTRSLTCGSPTGLVASYSFDEGSGGVLSDSSGNGHLGTVAGATWAAGRNGGALSFNGTGSYVDLGSLGTFYQGAFTLEAWVNKQTVTKNDAAVLGSWTSSGGPMIWVDHIATRYHLTLGSAMSGYLDSGANPGSGQWQHLAATFDGTIARFYIDGAEVASRAAGGVGSSDSWRIGAYGSSPGGFFDGLVDDVRIYDRALSETEIQTDMTQPVTILAPPTDTTPPTAPGSLDATIRPSRATLRWAAATDNVGVTRFNVHRSTQPGFLPTAANRIAQPATASYTDSGLAAATYYYVVTAEDAAGNVSDTSNEAAADVPPPDTISPDVSIVAPGAGAVTGAISITADATDQWGVAGVQFRVDGRNFGPEDKAAPYTVSWDTRGELNGPYTLTAVALDGAGNTATSASVLVNVLNEGGATQGLRAAYAFDEVGGTAAADSSGNGKTATLVGASRTSGRFGTAAAFDGTAARIDPPALGSFYKTAFTFEAWVYKLSTKSDVAVVGSWAGGQGGGPMIWVDHVSGRYRLTLGNNFAGYLDSGRAPAAGQWQHVAATYNGSVARFYVNGVETASAAFSSNVGNSNTWRIGAYAPSPAGFFDGQIDNVRIYDRALTPAEIAANKASRIQLDREAPTVSSSAPPDAATEVGVAEPVTATFDEPMQELSITDGTFTLRDASNNVVPATVSYDLSTSVATLTPAGALEFGTTYRARLDSPAVEDLSGNALAADVSWSFTTEASPPPVLVVGSTANKYGAYLGEILRAEGLNAFTMLDVAFLTPALLSRFDVVVLGEMPLTPVQVSTLSGWVGGGGNLVVMRPDKQLAGLLGLVDAGSTLSNAYLQVDASVEAGAGIVGGTIQFHGTADRYTLNGATAVATLFSSASSATANPAVTLRSVGTNGGQVAAFTYDLARSVVYTRQGNPAWAGQERDGVLGLRPDDLFFGARAGDVQPDWVDTNKIAIPQADEQQRLLANLITLMERDKMPLPRFWYLPRGEKAVVLMSGDDHSPSQASGGTSANFDGFKALSPPGCAVASWECVRATSYIYPNSNISNAQAAAYAAEGFELALHPNAGSCPSAPISQPELTAILDGQLASWRTKYTSLTGPVSNRTHCVYWPDWASSAKAELAGGMRLDANYYHYPGSWIGTRNGFMTGGGFPMRFADLDGTIIDAYQANTNLTDETTSAYTTAIAALLDNALGAPGYYGAFGTNMHTDNPSLHPGAQAIVSAAQARSVPLISYKQMLEWTDGRNNSTIRGLAWNAGTLTLATTIGTGATGLQTMLPTQAATSTLTTLTCAGTPTPYTTQTIKGIQYALFDTTTGTCQATYS